MIDSYGFLNSVLMKLGMSDPIQWLTDTKFMMPVVIVVILWLSIPIFETLMNLIKDIMGGI